MGCILSCCTFIAAVPCGNSIWHYNYTPVRYQTNCCEVLFISPTCAGDQRGSTFVRLKWNVPAPPPKTIIIRILAFCEIKLVNYERRHRNDNLDILAAVEVDGYVHMYSMDKVTSS